MASRVDRVRVAVELGQDRELVQGQLLVQVARPWPGLSSTAGRRPARH